MLLVIDTIEVYAATDSRLLNRNTAPLANMF